MLGGVANKVMFPGPPEAVAVMNEGQNRIFIEVDGSSRVILFSHGNTANIGCMKKSMETLSVLTGVSVCLYEYPGYTEGESSTQEKANEAIKECLEWLVYVKGYSVSQIILMGQSIGTCPTIWLASQRDIDNNFAGIILWSAISSIQDIAYHLLSGIWRKQAMPWFVKCFINPISAFLLTSWPFLGNRYNNVAAIALINKTTPVLFIHGRLDDITPIHFMEALKKALPEQSQYYEYVEDYGMHNACDEDRLFLEIASFITKKLPSL